MGRRIEESQRLDLSHGRKPCPLTEPLEPYRSWQMAGPQGETTQPSRAGPSSDDACQMERAVGSSCGRAETVAP